MGFDLLGLVFSVVAAAAVAFVGRRVLGVPVGWPRSILVGLLVLSGLNVVLPRIGDRIGLRADPVDESTVIAGGLVFLLVLGWLFFLGIALLVALELVIPTGSVPTPWQVWRDLRRRHRRTRRYLQVLAIAARHGLGGFVGRSSRRARARTPATSRAALARSLRIALNEGGVTFIKIGQMLATRPDLVGPSFAAELTQLQTASEPVPWASLAPAVEAAVGGSVEETFAEIDESPLATASVAQVHTARLTTGAQVVIKVQKPAARAQVEGDLDIVARLADRLDRSTGWGRALGVRTLADGFATSLVEELDYRIEADNVAAVTSALPADSCVRIPAVLTDLSSDTVLVQEQLSGLPVSRAAAELGSMTSEQRGRLADGLLAAVLHQILVDGVFHADLHPGNVVVLDAETLGLLDFGSVGRLDDATREAVGRLLVAVDRGASTSAADALLDVLDPPAEPVNDRRWEREVGQLLVRYGTGTRDTSGMFAALFGLVHRYGFGVPAQVAAAFRTLAALEGTLSVIDPDLDLVGSLREQGGRLLRDQSSRAAVRTQVENELIALLPLLRRVPRRLDKITAELEQGRLSINVRLLGDARDRDFVLGTVHQLVIAVLASAATVAAILLIVAPGSPELGAGVALFPVLGCCLLFVGCVLALRSLVLVFRRSWSP